MKADTPTTKDEIGEELVIKDQDIKVNDDNGLLTETDYLKYFNFKDKDQTKIRMYNEKKVIVMITIKTYLKLKANYLFQKIKWL